jgi:ADP-ribosylglycohydrolase
VPTRAERLAGGLIGLPVGDALGVPYGFHAADEIPPLDQIEVQPPAGFTRAHRGVAPGTRSDDGAMALCLLASLLERGCLDAAGLGRRFLRWYDDGYLAVDGVVFDVGLTVESALRRLRTGMPALEAGATEEQALGNGSLMPVLPLALWHRGTDAELAADAQAQSRVTHGHVRAQVYCALYCLWARRTLDGRLDGRMDAWQAAVAALRGLYSTESEAREELERAIRPDDPAEEHGSGYVVDCLRSAQWRVEQGPYERVVKAAVALGNDTETLRIRRRASQVASPGSATVSPRFPGGE